MPVRSYRQIFAVFWGDCKELQEFLENGVIRMRTIFFYFFGTVPLDKKKCLDSGADIYCIYIL